MLKKIIYIFFFFSFYASAFYAQKNSFLILKKQTLLKELTSLKAERVAIKKKGLGNALLNIYQKHISVLISADCLYSLSCSSYSREVVNKYGFISGVLLSADRLTRCSFFCGKDIPESKYNIDGLAQDNP